MGNASMLTLRQVYEVLAANIEPGEWWPAKSRFEIMVGAVLTQNTAWTNVERCIDRLNQAEALSAEGIQALEVRELQELIKPSGYWRAKTGYLKNIAHWYLTYDRDAHTMDDQTLRKELLIVRGIGDETADDILLYAYERPVFIYDLYARRLLGATGFGHFNTYRQAKSALDPLVLAEGFTTPELAEFHGLIVQAGKQAQHNGDWPTYWKLLTQSTHSPNSTTISAMNEALEIAKTRSDQGYTDIESLIKVLRKN